MIDSDFDTLDKLLDDDLIYTRSTAQSDARAEYTRCARRTYTVAVMSATGAKRA
jgi:hypothetical protein